MLNQKFLKDAADRVLSTAFFTLIGYLISVDNFDLWTVDWKTAINVTVVAALGSLAKAGVVKALPRLGTPGTATPVDFTDGHGGHVHVNVRKGDSAG